MAEPIDIAEHSPHFGIRGPSGGWYVTPVSVVQRMVSGSLPLRQEGQEKDDDDFLRGVLADWLHLRGISGS